MGNTVTLSRKNEVNLAYLNLKRVPAGLFAARILANATKISLTGNLIQTLPSTIGNFKHLVSLDLAGNLLVSVPDTIGQLVNLEELSISHNQIQALPNTLFRLTQLRSLDLSNNLLTDVSNSIGGLERLEFLKLGNNRLTTLPNTIKLLKSLSKFEYKRNTFKEAPLVLADLVSFELIDLEESGVEVLTPEFAVKVGSNKAILDVNLSRNQIMFLPEEFLDLFRLRSIDLTFNPIIYWPKSAELLPNITVNWQWITDNSQKIESLRSQHAHILKAKMSKSSMESMRRNSSNSQRLLTARPVQPSPNETNQEDVISGVFAVDQSIPSYTDNSSVLQSSANGRPSFAMSNTPASTFEGASSLGHATGQWVRGQSNASNSSAVSIPIQSSVPNSIAEEPENSRSADLRRLKETMSSLPPVGKGEDRRLAAAAAPASDAAGEGGIAVLAKETATHAASLSPSLANSLPFSARFADTEPTSLPITQKAVPNHHHTIPCEEHSYSSAAPQAPAGISNTK